MDLLSKIGTWLNGKKTYIISILIGVAGILTTQGIVIPEYVWALLAAAGLGAVRSGVGTK